LLFALRKTIRAAAETAVNAPVPVQKRINNKMTGCISSRLIFRDQMHPWDTFLRVLQGEVVFCGADHI